MTRSPRLLVAGGSSFIGAALLACTRMPVQAIGRAEDVNAAARCATVIVNALTDPRIKDQPYREAHDRDLAAARAAHDAGAHFVMLSTRKIYAPGAPHACLDEGSAPDPRCRYGENKFESERRVLALLGDRATVLRLGNVYGWEPGRRSFFGIALGRLAQEGRIVLDVSPFTERDFISVDRCAALLDAVCAERPAGIWCVGEGRALPLGRIAQWLIEGHGSGRLEIDDVRERDGFTLLPTRLHDRLGFVPAPDDPAAGIRALGRRLHSLNPCTTS